MHPWAIKVVQLWQGVAFDHLQDWNCLENRLERWSWGNFGGGVLPSLHSERPWLCYKYVTILQFCGLVILKTFSGPSLMLNQDLIPKQAPCAGSQSTVYWCLLDSDTVILCLGTFCIWTERGSQGHTKDDSDFPRQNILGPDGIDSLAGAADYGPKTQEEHLISTCEELYRTKKGSAK